MGFGSGVTSHSQKTWDWAAKGLATVKVHETGEEGEKNFCVTIIGLMCVCVCVCVCVCARENIYK